MNTESEKPTMTKKEASWRVVIAGIQAKAAATRNGDTHGRRALMDAVGVEVAPGLIMYPPSANTIEVMNAVQEVYELATVRMPDIGALLVMTDSKTIWRKIRGAENKGTLDAAKAFTEWFDDRCFDLGDEIPLTELPDIRNWIEACMKDLRPETAEEPEGK
jgi:hypothetical protein